MSESKEELSAEARHWRELYRRAKAELDDRADAQKVSPPPPTASPLEWLIPLAATAALNFVSLALLAPVALMEEPPKQYMALSVFIYAIAGVTLILDLFLFLDALVFRSFALPKVLADNRHGEVGWLVGALILGIAWVVASR